MVAHSRAPLGARALRALNAPVPIAVQADAAGEPQAVRRSRWRALRPVQAIQDYWRIDDEWWRERPIARLYYTILLDDEALLTIYHDLVTDAWFEQRG